MQPTREAPEETGTLDISTPSASAPVQLRSPGHVFAKISIAPPKRWVSINFRELWDAHELIYFLIWRDLKVRYKQTALGASWIIVQPLATMLIFSLFFGRVARIPSDGIPYPIFILTALVPWNLFASGVTRGSDSLIGNAALLKKVYLPRLALPTSRVLAGLIDFLLASVLVAILLAYYRVRPSVHILYLLPFVLLALLTAAGAALWLSAINVRMRDVQQAVPFLVQLWFFATPVAYPSSLIGGRWHVIYGLNPMASVVEGFRWALLGTRPSLGPMVAMSTVVAVILLVSGAMFFRRMEQTFADIV